MSNTKCTKISQAIKRKPTLDGHNPPLGRFLVPVFIGFHPHDFVQTKIPAVSFSRLGVLFLDPQKWRSVWAYCQQTKPGHPPSTNMETLGVKDQSSLARVSGAMLAKGGVPILPFDEDPWKNTNLSRSEIDSLENQQGKMKKIFLSANGSQLGGS